MKFLEFYRLIRKTQICGTRFGWKEASLHMFFFLYFENLSYFPRWFCLKVRPTTLKILCICDKTCVFALISFCWISVSKSFFKACGMCFQINKEKLRLKHFAIFVVCAFDREMISNFPTTLIFCPQQFSFSVFTTQMEGLFDYGSTLQTQFRFLFEVFKSTL